MKSIAGVLLYNELLPILRELLWACSPDDLECHANLCTILLKVTALLFFYLLNWYFVRVLLARTG